MIDNFTQGFFEDEVREGFFIEKKMKSAWAAQMEVLVEIDRICKKHNIQYFAGFGTLLGAIRHKGFIPWDDDMDILMLRKDYERFIRVVNDELPGDWLFLNTFHGRRKGWRQVFSRVTNSDRINTGKEHLLRFHGCPYIVGIDLFPVDILPADKEEEKVLYEVLVQLFRTMYLIRSEAASEIIEDCLKSIELYCDIKIMREADVLEQLIYVSDNLLSMYQNEEKGELALFSWGLEQDKKYQFKREWFEDSMIVSFENISIPVPVRYKEVLTAFYGEDYMTPRQFVAGHDYPFYKEQEEELARLRMKE